MTRTRWGTPLTFAVFAASGCAAVIAACTSHGDGPHARTAADTVRMAVAWAVLPGVTAYGDSFGNLSGLAVDTRGNVYASDFLAHTIWIFDSTGIPEPRLGRKGDGPGEFNSPTGLGIGPKGLLYVRDVNRVTVFAADSATGRLTRYARDFPGPPYEDWTSKRPTRFDREGVLFYPGTKWLVPDTNVNLFVRFSPSGRLLDSLRVPSYPGQPPLAVFVQTSRYGGRMLRGFNHVPFAAVPVWDVLPNGDIVSGDGRSYVLRETDSAGRVVRVFHRTVAAVRISAAVRRDSARALRDRLDSIPVPLSGVRGMPDSVRDVELPHVYPAYMDVYAGSDGSVWVRRWPVGSGGISIFDVFSSDGAYRHTVVLPRVIASEPAPVLSMRGVAGVTVDPETGEFGVIDFRR